jgi:tRNA U34 2-thiouridine synthase MnmA/TrmU
MKAIALISGGLDSTLAAKLTKELGIELVALNTVSPFCLCNQRSSSGCVHGAGRVARELGLKLISINVAEEFIEIVRKPKHGYGSNMNPCIDCRILLFRKAKIAMEQEGASFVITGEVLGQRPMSQKLNTMRIIEKDSGLEGLVVRPLSAQVLEPTIPERNGWIPRDKLLAINGRGRKEQFTLAREFGIKDYPCPSGGCLLTDREFSRRLKDIMDNGEFNLDEVILLKTGRHFRLKKGAKLVVGRNESENGLLESAAKDGDRLFYPKVDLAGPTSLLRGGSGQDLIDLSSRITAHYCDLNGNEDAAIFHRLAGAEESCLKVAPIEEELLEFLRI